MPRKDSGPARGNPRTRKVKSAGERAVPQQTLRRSAPAFPESLDALGRLTRKDLLDLARRAGLRGRSRLKKEELARALWPRLKMPAPQTEIPPSPPLLDWENAPLPEAYGRDRLVLMPIDPYWVHAYWEMRPRSEPGPRRGAEKESERARCILRVYDVTLIDFDGTNAHSSFDIEITPQARNWYMNLWSAGKSLCAELGLVHRDGTFSSLIRSNVIQTPPAWISPKTEERWVRVEWEPAGHFPLQAPASSEVAASVPQAGLHESSGPPGTGDGELRQRSQECVRAEEYRRLLEETRRLKMLGRDELAPPLATSSPLEELVRGFDPALSSLELVKKR